MVTKRFMDNVLHCGSNQLWIKDWKLVLMGGAYMH